MSRTSLNQRLASVRNALLPPGSMAYREHHLPDRERRGFQQWRADCSVMIASAESEGPPGEAYRQMIEDELVLPPMPHPVSAALGIVIVSTGDPASHYQTMLEGREA